MLRLLSLSLFCLSAIANPTQVYQTTISVLGEAVEGEVVVSGEGVFLRAKEMTTPVPITGANLEFVEAVVGVNGKRAEFFVYDPDIDSQDAILLRRFTGFENTIFFFQPVDGGFRVEITAAFDLVKIEASGGIHDITMDQQVVQVTGGEIEGTSVLPTSIEELQGTGAQFGVHYEVAGDEFVSPAGHVQPIGEAFALVSLGSQPLEDLSGKVRIHFIPRASLVFSLDADTVGEWPNSAELAKTVFEMPRTMQLQYGANGVTENLDPDISSFEVELPAGGDVAAKMAAIDAEGRRVLPITGERELLDRMGPAAPTCEDQLG